MVRPARRSTSGRWLKKKVFDKDEAAPVGKAQELGRAARALAGPFAPISTLHAAVASYQVDCPPIGDLEDWCN